MKSQQYHKLQIKKEMVCWEKGKEIYLQIGKKCPFKNWKQKSNQKWEMKIQLEMGNENPIRNGK